MESNLLESNYGPEYEYVSFFAIEYEYIYPVGEVKLSPRDSGFRFRKGQDSGIRFQNGLDSGFKFQTCDSGFRFRAL